MSVDWSQVGSKIRLARKRTGLTQEQVAGKELTKGFISLVESGKARPSRRSLLIICDRLGLSLNDILGEEAGPEELLEVSVAQSKALLKSSNTAEAIRKLRDALSIAERLPPDRWTGIVLKELGIAHVLRGAPAEGFQLLTESLPHLKSKEQSIHMAEALLYLGNVHSDRHQLFQALESFRRSYQVLSSMDDAIGNKNPISLTELKLHVLTNLAGTCRKLGRINESTGYYQEALELAEAVSDPWRLATLYMGLSLACSKKGDYSGAIDYAERARDLFGSLGNSKLVASILNNIGMAHAAKGEWTGAMQYFKKSLDLFEKVPDENAVAYVLTEMAKYHRQCQEYDKALDLCTKALARVIASNDKAEEARITVVQGSIYAATGDYSRAEQLLQRGVELFEDLSMQDELAGAYSELGKVVLHRDPVTAAELLVKSTNLFKKAHGLVT